jgi:sterol 3beta-glucosyltransferase
MILEAGQYAPPCHSTCHHVSHHVGRVSGNRLVVSCGWGGTAKRENSASVFFIDACPHDWLFPQMKAVIHHGGAGTVYGYDCSLKEVVA